MAGTILFDNGTHRNILLEDSGSAGSAVQANQHLIVHDGEAMLLDPGGHKVYYQVLSTTCAALGRGRLPHLFLSHQDPDIVAAVNGWLMTTDATAYISVAVAALRAAFRRGRSAWEAAAGHPRRGHDVQVGGSRCSRSARALPPPRGQHAGLRPGFEDPLHRRPRRLARNGVLRGRRLRRPPAIHGRFPPPLHDLPIAP